MRNFIRRAQVTIFVLITSWLLLLSSFFATFVVTSIAHFVNALMFYDLFELLSRD